MDLNSNEQVNIEISSSESETENEHPVINDSENIEMIRSEKSKYHVIGRSRSNIWQLYSNATECHKLKAAVCRHCNNLVNHHKKSELARNHLLKCREFRSYVNRLDDSEWPDCYTKKKIAG